MTPNIVRISLAILTFAWLTPATAIAGGGQSVIPFALGGAIGRIQQLQQQQQTAARQQAAAAWSQLGSAVLSCIFQNYRIDGPQFGYTYSIFPNDARYVGMVQQCGATVLQQQQRQREEADQEQRRQLALEQERQQREAERKRQLVLEQQQAVPQQGRMTSSQQREYDAHRLEPWVCNNPMINWRELTTTGWCPGSERDPAQHEIKQQVANEPPEIGKNDKTAGAKCLRYVKDQLDKLRYYQSTSFPPSWDSTTRALAVEMYGNHLNELYEEAQTACEENPNQRIEVTN